MRISEVLPDWLKRSGPEGGYAFERRVMPVMWVLCVITVPLMGYRHHWGSMIIMTANAVWIYLYWGKKLGWFRHGKKEKKG